jgi:hypothetical protein
VPDDVGDAAERLPPTQELTGAEQDRADPERQQIIDGPEGEQGAEHGRGRQARGQQHEDRRLEDAEAAGDVADGPETGRHEVGAEEAYEGRGRDRRQEDIENGGGNEPVERGDKDLGKRQRRRRKPNQPAADPQRLLARAAP